MKKKSNLSSSQAELQAAGYKAVRNFKNAIFTETETAGIASVISYDDKKHIADIQPLTRLSDGQLPPQLLDVPVAESCYLYDELVEAWKVELKKVDSNNGLPEHAGTSFSAKLPKKKLMRKGVPVVYLALDRDLDNWAGGRSVEPFSPNTSRNHDANDSIIIAVLGGTWLDG